MSALFCSRAGIAVFGKGIFCKADWPLGRITLNQNALTLAIMWKNYRIPISDIDAIRARLLEFEIQHHAAEVPKNVRIWGIYLFRRFRQAILRHELPIRIMG